MRERSLQKGDSPKVSTNSPKQDKKQGLISPNLAFALVLLIGTLVVLGAPTSSTYDPFQNTLGSTASITNSDGVSFSSDIQYWGSKCSHGWSSNAACDNIVSRAQLCARGLASTYCSDYRFYMRQFYSQRIVFKDYPSL